MATCGETVETVSDFIFLSAKITADGDCSHEIKRHLLLGRKTMTNPNSILKTNKGPYSQSCGFPVVMHGCECWTIKKAECQRINVFELWFWRRLLRITARRSNWSTCKKISPEYLLEVVVHGIAKSRT